MKENRIKENQSETNQAFDLNFKFARYLVIVQQIELIKITNCY